MIFLFANCAILYMCTYNLGKKSLEHSSILHAQGFMTIEIIIHTKKDTYRIDSPFPLPISHVVILWYTEHIMSFSTLNEGNGKTGWHIACVYRKPFPTLFSMVVDPIWSRMYIALLNRPLCSKYICGFYNSYGTTASSVLPTLHDLLNQYKIFRLNGNEICEKFCHLEGNNITF